MIELTQEFGFDAAHYLGQGAPDNSRLHGHSFYAEVTLRGEPDPRTGWLRDLGEVKAALEGVRSALDHRLLNEVEGLGNPTLENLVRVLAVLRRTDFLSPPRGQARGLSAAIRALRPHNRAGFPADPHAQDLPAAAWRHRHRSARRNPGRCRQRHSLGPLAGRAAGARRRPDGRRRRPCRLCHARRHSRTSPTRAPTGSPRCARTATTSWPTRIPIRAAWPCSAPRPCCRRHRFRHLDRPFRNGYSLP